MNTLCSNKYISDKSLKERLEILFIKDHATAIKFRIFSLIYKLATCVLYVVEVIQLADYTQKQHQHGSEYSQLNGKELNKTTAGAESVENAFNWSNLLYVKRHPWVEQAQVGLAVLGLCEAFFYLILTFSGSLVQVCFNPYFWIEIGCTLSWILEYAIKHDNALFIPVFLNCWLIKRNLSYIFKDFNNITVKHQNSVIGQQLISLATVLLCLVFSSACGFEYFQRVNIKNSVSLTDSFYFIVVTFTTVGYGDIVPDTWPAKFFVGFMMVIALVVIPTQLEHLASLWIERQTLGASYSTHRAVSEKHIVVCTTALQYDLIIDFLNEFYAHRKNQSIHTILLSSSDIDIQLRSLLHTPLWKQRVFYIHGSALRDNDLDRAKVAQARAVFIIPSRGIDKDMADQHTILRSWAIKDFAPNTPQFVQLFRPEHTINTKFAEYLVCEDEFKYALMANNCLCPGISTLITLLLHKATTNQTKENETWQEYYGRLAGNEVHSILAGNSKFFGEFVGKSFTEASNIIHRRYNVCLIGIGVQKKEMNSMASKETIDQQPQQQQQRNESVFANRTVLLNPGASYKIEADDLCLYIALVKEENYNFREYKYKNFAVEELCHNLLVSGPDLSMREIASKRIREESNLENLQDLKEQVSSGNATSETMANFANIHQSKPSHSKYAYTIRESDLIIGRPLSPLYIGTLPPLCKLLRVPTHICCLELNHECEHKKNIQAADYRWKNKCIVVVAENANSGLYNFILPLRAKSRSTMFLKPIVMLVEKPPTLEFLEAISCFPLVYWIQGSITNINTILTAGIMDSDYIIVVSPEKHAHIDDDSLTDCSNIVAVQNLYRLFPRVKVVAELTKASNIRFLKTRAKEISLEQTTCKLPYMFRLPFASGNVFSASMIDTLLYQTFGKPYLIELIRLLIGISQTPGSGNITSIPLTMDDMWLSSYGNLYRKLITTTGEIPIGLYRTISEEYPKRNMEKQGSKIDNTQQMIMNKMNKLGINTDHYKAQSVLDPKSQCVLINPGSDFTLKPGDIVYLIKPGNLPTGKLKSIKELPSDVAFSLNESESSDELNEFLTPTNLSPSLARQFQGQEGINIANPLNPLTQTTVAVLKEEKLNSETVSFV